MLFGACTVEPATTDTTSTTVSSTTSTRALPAGTLFGFFPFPAGTSSEAVNAHFQDLSEHGDVVLLQPNVPWEDFQAGIAGESGSRDNLRNLAILAKAHGLGTIVVVDPLNGLDRKQFFGLPESWEPSFSNPDVRSAMSNFALWVVRELKPKYLGLSSEINTYLATHPDDAASYMSLYREIYSAIKAEAPDTLVFVTFQWELVNDASLANFEAGIAPEPDWGQIERFEPSLDVWAISSYPFVAFPTGADIPDDYYGRLLSRTTKPLAVAEGGFLSRPTGPFPGDPVSQADQIAAVHDQIGDRLDFWIHLVLDDFDPDAIGEPMREQGHSQDDVISLGIFSSIGLRGLDSNPRPALELWDGYRAAR